MAIDWDAELLGPVMGLFGEGDSADASTWPIYSPAGGAPFALAGAVFDREFLEVTTNADGSDNTSRRPVLGVRVSLFPSPPVQGDLVRIPSVGLTYIVREVQPDGHGHAKLMLMKTAS